MAIVDEEMLQAGMRRIAGKIDADRKGFQEMTDAVGAIYNGKDSDLILASIAYYLDQMDRQGLPAEIALALLAKTSRNVARVELLELKQEEA